MAGRRTGPTGLGLLEIHIKGPVALAERYLLPDVDGVLACVYLVAGPACSALILLVNVYEMQVQIPVLESGQPLAGLDEHQVAHVALKAQAVVLEIKRRIKEFRIRLVEQPEVARAMRIVAGAAIGTVDRPVMDRIILQQGGDVRQLLAVGQCDLFVMAAQADIHRRFVQQSRQRAGVWVVTFYAGIGARDGGVDVLAGLDQIGHVLVTTEAQLVLAIAHLHRVVRAVRVVALPAVFFRRCMDMSRIGQLSADFFVARQTKFTVLLDGSFGLAG